MSSARPVSVKTVAALVALSASLSCEPAPEPTAVAPARQSSALSCGNSAQLSIAPNSFQARSVFPLNGQPLTFTFTADQPLTGNGYPWTDNPPTQADLIKGQKTDGFAVVELELPLAASALETDEGAHAGSFGLKDFDKPQLCAVADILANDTSNCPALVATSDAGFWRACIIPSGASDCSSDGSTEVQVARAQLDPAHGSAYTPSIGVFLPTPASGQPNNTLNCGDRIKLSYVGKAPGRATDNTCISLPLQTHFRYRPTGANEKSGCNVGGNWLYVDKVNGTTPIYIHPGPAAFIHVIAPLDVTANNRFDVAVSQTDQYGNPAPFTMGGVNIEVDNANPTMCTVDSVHPYRCVVSGVVVPQGFHRLSATLDGTMYMGNPNIRLVPQWTNAWSGSPPMLRRFGDVHSHSGDGGAQIEFLGTYLPGDHDGLFVRTEDVLNYMDWVAGLDFGAVSEHAMQGCDWKAPSYMLSDCAFNPKHKGCPAAAVGNDTGMCAPGKHPQTGHATRAGHVINGLSNTYVAQQLDAVWDYDQRFKSGGFEPFDAYEWHAQQDYKGASDTPVHRVVLFRDLVDPAPTDLEPIAFNPGNLDNIAPQCIQRFINDAIQAGAVTGGSVMVVPHMMKASDENIDWLLTYQNSANQLVANTAAVEQLTTVGEVYSARAEDQGYVYGTQSQLTAFEDPKPQPAPDPCSATQPCPTGLTCEKDGLCSAVSSCQTNADCPSGRICFEGLCSEKKAGHWTYRWGWQIAGAYIGVIGSSDNHSQMAGVNDEMPALPSMTSSPVADNEPGGYAVVLSSGAVEAKKGKRFGIFDGMRASRTYATTATRAYLDYSVASTAMGGALASTNGTETASITLCAGVPIDKIELWGAQTTNQTTLDYQLERVVNLSGQDKECFTGTVTLFNQSTVTNRYVEWLYYVRAFLKWPNSSNAGPDEAVWSSPIWVEWEQVVHPPPPPPPPPPGPCPPNCPI